MTARHIKKVWLYVSSLDFPVLKLSFHLLLQPLRLEDIGAKQLDHLFNS